jgi:hypothetical protein
VSPVAKYWTGSAWAPIAGAPGPALVTSLPAGPVDGQEVYYLADGTNGVVWHLRYRAASASAYKWEFVGGPPLAAVGSDTLDTTASTTPVDLSPLVAVTVPLAGDYDLAHGFGFGDMTPATYHFTVLNVGGADFAASVIQVYPVSGGVLAGAIERRRTALTASASVRQRGYNGGAGATGRWRGRWVKATPVRVG